MKILKTLETKLKYAFLLSFGVVYAAPSNETNVITPFKIPSIADLISFFIKFFFFIAGMAALIYLLLGAFGWVTSSGDKENVKKAQDKIQAAVTGLIIIVAVLAIMVTLEQFVFNKAFCLGLSCPINLSQYTLLQNN